MGKKGDLSDFEHGMFIGARRAGLSISKTADLLGFLCTTIFRVYREWPEKEKMSNEWQLCERKCRLVRDDRKATVTQITTRYNQGNAEYHLWTHNTLNPEADGLQQQKTTPGVVYPLEPQLWHKEHESMDPSCLVSTVQAGGGGVMVRGIFSWHTLGPIEHLLNATAYLSIVADHVHPFMTTVYPSPDG